MAPGASIACPLSARHIEDMLELGHGFSRETLATLVLNGLAMVMTETLSLGGATIKIERMSIKDAGRRAIRGCSLFSSLGRNSPRPCANSPSQSDRVRMRIIRDSG